MTEIINSFIDHTVQCWGCGVFDRLFQVVSTAAAELYTQMSNLAFIVFFALFTAFVVNAIYQNLKGGGKDPFYEKSILCLVKYVSPSTFINYYIIFFKAKLIPIIFPSLSTVTLLQFCPNPSVSYSGCIPLLSILANGTP